MIKTGEWISEAWELVKQDLWMHVLIVLVLGVLSGVPLIGPAMLAGYYLIIFRKLTGQRAPAVGDIFEGFQLFVPALLVGIVGGLIAGLGVIACIVGVFVTTAMVMFAMPLVVDRKMDFWPAIQMSMDKVKENYVGWGVFVLALMGVQLLGVIACGVGVFVAMPVIYVATAIAYRDTFGIQMVEAGGAAAPMAPPPVAPPAPPQAPTAPPRPQ